MTPRAAVVPAAGLGTRLDAGAPKALVPVGGVAMVRRAVDGLLAADVVDAVVVAAPPGRTDKVRAVLPADGRVRVVDGAADRVASVAAALDTLAPEVHTVLVHDAARCLCPTAVIRAVAAAVAAGAPAVVPGVPVADTLKRVARGRVRATVDRDGLVGVQTPQGFAAATLRAAHDRAARERARDGFVPATDDAGLVEADGGTVDVVPGDPRGMKITTGPDLALADALAGAAAGTP